MKLSALFILFVVLSVRVAGQDNSEQVITKNYYNKWSITFIPEHLIEYQQGSANGVDGSDGITILYYPLIMIDDGIFGSVGIMLTKEKKPEYILELSFPVGIGNRSYENLESHDMVVRVFLMSGKDSVFKSASSESKEDQIALNGNQFKSRLYRFPIGADDFEKLKTRVPDKMLLYYKSKNSTTTQPKRRPPPGYISSENSKISKFYTFAKSIDEVRISEIH